MPSPLSEMPGDEDDVMARAPAAAAPYTMLIAATSLSACRYVPPTLGMRLDMYAASSVCGVMGYPKKKRHPARIAASASASLPFMSTFSAMPSLPFHRDGHVGAHRRAGRAA